MKQAGGLADVYVGAAELVVLRALTELVFDDFCPPLVVVLSVVAVTVPC